MLGSRLQPGRSTRSTSSTGRSARRRSAWATWPRSTCPSSSPTTRCCRPLAAGLNPRAMRSGAQHGWRAPRRLGSASALARHRRRWPRSCSAGSLVGRGAGLDRCDQPAPCCAGQAHAASWERWCTAGRCAKTARGSRSAPALTGSCVASTHGPKVGRASCRRRRRLPPHDRPTARRSARPRRSARAWSPSARCCGPATGSVRSRRSRCCADEMAGRHNGAAGGAPGAHRGGLSA